MTFLKPNGHKYGVNRLAAADYDKIDPIWTDVASGPFPKVVIGALLQPACSCAKADTTHRSSGHSPGNPRVPSVTRSGELPAGFAMAHTPRRTTSSPPMTRPSRTTLRVHQQDRHARSTRGT